MHRVVPRSDLIDEDQSCCSRCDDDLLCAGVDGVGRLIGESGSVILFMVGAHSSALLRIGVHNHTNAQGLLGCITLASLSVYY